MPDKLVKLIEGMYKGTFGKVLTKEGGFRRLILAGVISSL